MARYEFRSPRLFVASPLSAGMAIALDKTQSNYLCNVLRLSSGDAVLVFNGRDGEWRAALERDGKRSVNLLPQERIRAQENPADLSFMFAPLKHARLDYMVQKAVELGVSRLQPVITQFTQVSRVNSERMHANAIEAAEQCGILNIPHIASPVSFERALSESDGRIFIFCDEDATPIDPVQTLSVLRVAQTPPSPLAVLIGPEGGFSEEERAMLLGRAKTIRLSLGPRILRADTAAVAALTLVQAVLGDWR